MTMSSMSVSYAIMLLVVMAFMSSIHENKKNWSDWNFNGVTHNLIYDSQNEWEREQEKKRL